MGGINGAADVEGDVGRVLEEGVGEQARPVLAVAPGEIGGIALLVILRQGEDFVEGDDAFGREVYPVDEAIRGDVGIQGYEVPADRGAQVARDDFAGRSPADDVLSRQGEEAIEHVLVVFSARGGPDEEIG